MLSHKKDRIAWLYIAIPLFLLTVFTFYPLIKTVLISFFTQYNPTNDTFGNYFDLMAYQAVFMDSSFFTALANTTVLVIFTVGGSTILALLIAVGLNSIKPLQKIFQTIFFIPYVTNTLAVGMVFSLMFAHPTVSGGIPEGLVNTILNLKLDWIGDTAPYERWMMVVVIYNVWNALPFKILVFIGGLQSISKQYYDAAKIDSTPKRRVFSKITVPLLSPLISYIVITSLIGAFKTYESVLAVAGEGRYLYQGKWTVVAYVYSKIKGDGWLDDNFVSYYSKGAAAAVILFIIIMIITVFNLYVSKKKVHY